MFSMLLRDDMWSESAQREKRRHERLAQAAKDREKQREREDRRRIVDRVRAARDTFVSMNRSSPWSQNTAGRRGVMKREP